MLRWIGVVVFGAGVAGVSSPHQDIVDIVRMQAPEMIRGMLPGLSDPLQARLACERAIEMLFEADTKAERTEAAAIVDRLNCRLANHVEQMGAGRR